MNRKNVMPVTNLLIIFELKTKFQMNKEGDIMKTSILVFFAFISTCFAQYKYVNDSIVLNATKDTAVTADEMIMQISVNKTDTSSSKVDALSHDNLVDVLNVLKKYGYKKEDIYLITSNLRLDYRRPPNRYSSVQSYKIILDKFDLYDQLKKDLVHAGATEVSISGFWCTDYDKVKKILYSEALAEAKARAKYFCSKIGAKSFSIVNLEDYSRNESINRDLSFISKHPSTSDQALTVSSEAKGARFVQPTVTNGQLNIRVSLRVTFKYKY